MRNFGVTSPATSGGVRQSPGSHYGRDTQPDPANSIWYEKARRVEPHEIEQIAEAIRIKNERAARNELHEARLIIARLEARLNAGDTDFYRADIDGLREAAARSGSKNRPLAR